MSRRIVTPINAVAFALAQQQFQAQHGAGLVLVPGTRQHRAKREAWLRLYAAAGGLVDAGDTFQALPVGGAVEPCPLKNVIQSVSFLSGAAALTANAAQHVNLPRDPKFVDGVRVTHLDRLGRALRVKVRFQRAKRERFKVALLAHNGNATYTGPEQAHSPSYASVRAAAAGTHAQGAFDHYQGAVYTGRTGRNGEAVIEGQFSVPASGGDRYTLVAWDVNGNVVFSAFEVTTRRTLFYATFRAADPAGAGIPAHAFGPLIQGAYAPHHIDLVSIGNEALNNVVYHDIITQGFVGDAVLALARTRVSALGRPYADYAPYLIKFVFVDHCAELRRVALQPTRFAAANPGDVLDVPFYNNNAVSRARDLAFDWRKCVWAGAGQPVSPRDRTTTGHEWFESASLTVHEGTGDRVVPLAATDLTLVPRAGEPEAKVEAQITLPPTFPAATDVTVNITAVIVYRSVLGQSMVGPHAGITLQPARHMFSNVDHNKQLASTIHECGHAIGMVADAGAQGVGHAAMYDFNGRHCWTGVAGPAASAGDYHQPPLKDTGTCVMYGLIPDAGANLAYCPACSAVLRKLDLSRGFTG
ncbi:MAG: hypothetical protein Q8S73_24025 [Deltaproteobacteria bacterium]|nr:hypothetical protein [Myxococcales bacterium]MDP3217201.1 hypothetical protein [Deltaproteobacteria bacterium]